MNVPYDLDDVPDFVDFEEPAGEPEAWHRIEIIERDTDVLVTECTNDDLDRGYPSKYASWESAYPTLGAALRHTGKSRYGMCCRVDVFVNGERV